MNGRHGLTAYDTLSNDSPLQAEWRQNSDGTAYECVRLFNDLGSATVAGRVYVLTYDGDEEKNPKIATPAALAVYQDVVVALGVVADQAWGWFVRQGYCDALVEGTTDVAKDDFLKITAATTTTAFIKDASARSTNSIAISTAAQTANSEVLTRVYLLGDRAILP